MNSYENNIHNTSKSKNPKQSILQNKQLSLWW